MKIAFIGGFYGSGKTTTISKMTKILKKRGKTVTIVGNEKDNCNVDSTYIKNLGLRGKEIDGGCICFYLNQLEQIIEDSNSQEVMFIEPISYFLPSKLFKDLRNKLGEKIDLSPIIIMLDGLELLNIVKDNKNMPFIDKRQIKDAEVIALNKIDLIPPKKLSEIKKEIKKHNPNIEIIEISAKKEKNLDKLINTIINKNHRTTNNPEQKTFQKFAKSVSNISERGEEFEFVSNNSIKYDHIEDFTIELVKEFREKLSNMAEKIHHIKVYVGNRSCYVKASNPRSTTEVDTIGEGENIKQGKIVINVIAEKVPEDLIYGIMSKTLKNLTQKNGIELKNL